MNAPKVTITFQETPRIDDSLALNELRDSLNESSIYAESEIETTQSGVKDGGLTLGLAIAGLALSAIGTLVSAISLWGSKRNYSISLKSGDTTFAANNLSAKEARTIAEAIKDEVVASDIKILVSQT